MILKHIFPLSYKSLKKPPAQKIVLKISTLFIRIYNIS